MDYRIEFWKEKETDPIEFLKHFRCTTEPIGGSTELDDEGELVDWDAAVVAVDIARSWNKQDKEDIYSSFNDWEYHRFVCLMKNGSIQVFTGICDEHDDGMVEKHLNCSTNDHFNIDDIYMWTEVPKNK